MRRGLLFCGVLFASFCSGFSRETVADPVPEYAMKAAFVYNFAFFTEWPSLTGDNLNLCVFGQDALGSELDHLDGKQVKGMRLRVLHLVASSYARSCNILYINEPEGADLQRIIDSLGDSPVLTISDDDNLAKSRAIISIKLENKRLAFEINQTAAQRSHLLLSSKLLSLAHRVY